jgi:hypothetical protein
VAVYGGYRLTYAVIPLQLSQPSTRPCRFFNYSHTVNYFLASVIHAWGNCSQQFSLCSIIAAAAGTASLIGSVSIILKGRAIRLAGIILRIPGAVVFRSIRVVPSLDVFALFNSVRGRCRAGGVSRRGDKALGRSRELYGSDRCSVLVLTGVFKFLLLFRRVYGAVVGRRANGRDEGRRVDGALDMSTACFGVLEESTRVDGAVVGRRANRRDEGRRVDGALDMSTACFGVLESTRVDGAVVGRRANGRDEGRRVDGALDMSTACFGVLESRRVVGAVVGRRESRRGSRHEYGLLWCP